MVTVSIIIVTSILSIVAFPEHNPLPRRLACPELLYKFKFNAYSVWHDGEYYRMLSSGFVHAGWWHLIFNMLTLYFFGGLVEEAFVDLFGNSWGKGIFLLFYLLGIIVSSVYDLIKYHDQEYYNAVGASGTVSAVLFASILIVPKMGIMFFFIPIPIPGYIFGPLFMLYSYYVMSKQKDSYIGHAAHFFGAVFGILFMIFIYPPILVYFINQFL